MAKYVYEKKTDTELQFWPNLSREVYFSKPFVDVAQINRNKNLVSCPPDCSIDYLCRHGILYAAVALHKRDITSCAEGPISTLFYIRLEARRY